MLGLAIAEVSNNIPFEFSERSEDADDHPDQEDGVLSTRLATGAVDNEAVPEACELSERSELGDWNSLLDICNSFELDAGVRSRTSGDGGEGGGEEN